MYIIHTKLNKNVRLNVKTILDQNTFKEVDDASRQLGMRVMAISSI